MTSSLPRCSHTNEFTSIRSSFVNFIYLFIFGCAGSSLLCGFFSSCLELELLSSGGTRASHRGGFSCLGPGGSRAVAHMLSCSMARGIFPDREIKPTSPALAGGFFTTELLGKPLLCVLINARV